MPRAVWLGIGWPYPLSPERAQRTEALVKATTDQALSSRVAELYFEVFEQ